MIVFLCAHVRISIPTYCIRPTSIVNYLPYRLILLDMHGNHHHHHQRTDLGGIMSITSVFTIGPFVPCTPHLCKFTGVMYTPVMSICLVKQNDGTSVEKHQRFLFDVYKRFLIFVTFFTFFLTFLKKIFGTFFTSMEWTIAMLASSFSGPMYCAHPVYISHNVYVISALAISRKKSESIKSIVCWNRNKNILR